MCKHLPNAQVAIRASCCRMWFDCALCHSESATDKHRLRRTAELTLACKKCRKVFRKQLEVFEESDEYCPNCDNHYLKGIDAQAFLSGANVAAAMEAANASTAGGGAGLDSDDDENGEKKSRQMQEEERRQMDEMMLMREHGTAVLDDRVKGGIATTGGLTMEELAELAELDEELLDFTSKLD
ncbi:hypothetical protein GQ42DRAFT_149533 [Ramicandelaber brevisporus]|nr:hypothetical protein GQ42DRAFT_149533 [Ramicandelaber brevisporus]